MKEVETGIFQWEKKSKKKSKSAREKKIYNHFAKEKKKKKKKESIVVFSRICVDPSHENWFLGVFIFSFG